MRALLKIVAKAKNWSIAESAATFPAICSSNLLTTKSRVMMASGLSNVGSGFAVHRFPLPYNPPRLEEVVRLVFFAKITILPKCVPYT